MLIERTRVCATADVIVAKRVKWEVARETRKERKYSKLLNSIGQLHDGYFRKLKQCVKVLFSGLVKIQYFGIWGQLTRLYTERVKITFDNVLNP